MSPHMLTPEEFERLIEIQTVTPQPAKTGSASPLLRQFAAVDRRRLAKLLTERRCMPGEVIFQEGEMGDTMYLIWSGRVMVLKGNLDSPTILGYRGPGEIIGEMALLDDQPRSATNIALEPLRMLTITRERFQEWLNSKPALSISIMATLSTRLRDAGDDIAAEDQVGKHLIQQVSALETERQHLLESQRVRQETSDLVVHDLRNPLGVILGALTMLEMVLSEEVRDANQELLGLAITACERMQRLVDSLLDVAKFETGEMPVRMALTNLSPILQEVLQQQSITAQSRNITLQLAIPHDLPQVVVDREKLERVLVNLLDNALKYTPNSGKIVLAAEAYADHLIISVTDEGPGIPQEERERIFERFAQIGDSNLTRRGFGLGLTFCRLAVAAHNGNIWVEPGTKGKGSRFAFTLPL